MKLLWQPYKRIFCEHFLGHCKAEHYTNRDRALVTKRERNGTKRTWQYHGEKKKSAHKQKQQLKGRLVTVFSCDLFVTCLSFSPCVSVYMLYSVYPFAIMCKI